MRFTNTRGAYRRLFIIVGILGAWLILCHGAMAQIGQNAVYNGVSPVPSLSFIDASQFASSPPPPADFCSVLNWVLTHSYPASGAVIDARGLNPNDTNMTCAGGWPRLLALTLLSRVARPSFAWAGLSEARSTRPERHQGRTLLPVAAGANMADAYVVGRGQGQDGREHNPGYELKQ